MLASTYPALDLFWTVLTFAALVVWVWLVVAVVADVFRSPDLDGWEKALWVVAVVLLPLIGLLVYLVLRGRSMTDRLGLGRRGRPPKGDVYAPPTARSSQPFSPGGGSSGPWSM